MSDPCLSCSLPDCSDACEVHLTPQQRYHRRLKAEGSLRRIAWQVRNATNRRVERIARQICVTMRGE